MRHGDSPSSLSLASTHSGISLFSLAHGRWRSRLGQPAQAARPNIVRVYGACAVSQCVLVRIYGGVFVKDSGRI